MPGENAQAILLLFDIDGTLLLGASAVHREALLSALAEVYGLASPGDHRVAAAGRTDTQIARAIAYAAGVAPSEFDARLADLVDRCTQIYAQLCPADLARHVAPGIPELLDALEGSQSARLSLLTGNYEPIARLKLERAGIGHHFAADQGAFGSDAERRELLGPIARARAGAPGPPHPREQTTIIGDTPLDIACARSDGLRVIAIATGPFSADALGAADAVAGDAYALRELILGPSATG